MPDFKPPARSMRRHNDDGVVVRPTDLIKKIVEPKCHVCQHPLRDVIDRLIMVKEPYTEVARLFSTDERKLDRRSIARHEKEHLNYEDEGLRRLIEYEAGLAEEGLEEGIQGAFLRRVSLDVAIKKVFDGVIDGSIPVESRDIVKMIELRERLDKDSSSTALEQYQTTHIAFREAVKEVCSPDQHYQILEITKQRLGLPSQAVLVDAPDS